MTTDVLVGRVFYRLNLNLLLRTSSRKRKREGSSSSRLATQKVSTDNDNDDDADEIPLVGYIFQPNHNNASAEFLLSVPRDLLKLTFDATRFKQTVRVHNYSIVPLSHERRSSELPNGLIEVEVGGMDVVGGVRGHGATLCSKVVKDDPWTLTQLQRRETVDRMQKVSSKTHLYCLQGVVSSISPIITMDPSDPFSLLELYDPRSTCLWCVAVIRQTALSCQAAILPGDTLALLNVKRQKWRISEMLLKKNAKHLHDRVPNYVFVVEDPHQVDWLVVQPTTAVAFEPPHPLTSLRGEIVSIHTIHVGDVEHIHYIELFNTEERTDQLFSLFVTYYPLSTAMQLSLQPGAIIEAISVHRISRFSYCACLRSSIVLIMNASDRARANSSVQPVSDRTRNGVIPCNMARFNPCAFLRIRRTYLELFCRQRLSVWLSSLEVSKSNAYLVPSLDDLIKSLLDDAVRKATSRNAYAEFFDHALDDCEMSECSQEGSGCQLSRHKKSGFALPLPVCLGRIYDITLKFLKSRLEGYADSVSSKDMQVGWTGSIVFSGCELDKALNEDSCAFYPSGRTSLDGVVYSGGFCSLKALDGMAHGIISDGRIAVPATFAEKSARYTSDKRGFVVIGVESVVLSFLCIGVSTPEKRLSNSEVKASPLPPYDRMASCGAKTGPCVLLERNGILFIASIYMQGKSKRHFGPHLPNDEMQNGIHHKQDSVSVGTVQGCLDPSIFKDDSTSFAALLSRKFFKLSKARNGLYNGCMIALSHVCLPLDKGQEDSVEDISTIQSIELKLSISIDDVKRLDLKRLFGNLLGMSVTEDQLTLAHVWWKSACCGRTCSLFGGGWDEITGESSDAARKMGVVVRIPRSAGQQDEKRGYIRFRCRLDELAASTECFRSMCGTKFASVSSHAVDFIGGRRFFPGMLNSRPRRRTLGRGNGPAQLAVAELLFTPRHAGIPTCSLADLHWAICADMKTRSRVHLAPSLVREIRRATFLGVSYCRARAECTKCFHSLKNPRSSQRDHKKKRINDGIVTSIATFIEKSFWDRPLPVGFHMNKDLLKKETKPGEIATKEDSNVNNSNPNARTTSLRCPNKCSPNYAAIKWECSGTLDDGTGQAKLYAERDAALMLLGMTARVREPIEAGAWLNENGIVFSKGMPPKAYLRTAVLTARSMAYDQLIRRGHGRCRQRVGRILDEEDVLQFLTPTTRAEYRMQHHCRQSKEPLRDLNYFVRCKPLSDDVVHLNQTAIEIATEGAQGATYTRDVATYSLPPLKLNLVDCCRASSSRPEAYQQLWKEISDSSR